MKKKIYIHPITHHTSIYAAHIIAASGTRTLRSAGGVSDMPGEKIVF